MALAPDAKIKPLRSRFLKTRTKDYRYFVGHVTPEIARQLENKTTICWVNGHMLSLPVCAINKFWREQSYCKRCPLFQKDDYAEQLRSLIEEWEKDDLEEEQCN